MTPELTTMVEKHVPWAMALAKKMASRGPRGAATDHDGIGLEALLEAATAWNPELSAFRPYCTRIIRGRIKDAWRRDDLLSRHEREKLDPVERHSVDTMALELRGAPNVPPNQEEIVDARMRLERIGTLPERLRDVVLLKAADWELKDIGRYCGVTTSMACRLMAQAAAMLGES